MTQQNYDFARTKSELVKHSDAALVFKMGDELINPGYHVTEIKQAEVTSLDCGQGADQWSEIIFQVVDGQSSSTAAHMSVSKFLAIANKGLADVGNASLYFEYSPGNRAFNKCSVSAINASEQQVTLELSPMTAVCKPMVRAAQAGAP